MANQLTSFSTIVGGFLKRNYGKGSVKIYETQNLKAFFLSKMDESDEKPSGDAYFIPVNVSGNESGRASNEAEAFDNPQTVTDQQFQIIPKHTFWPFQITGFALDAATSNLDSFARTLDRVMTDSHDRMFSDLGRQSLGNGIGVLTTLSVAAVATPTLTLTSLQYIRQDMRLDLFATIGGAVQALNVRVIAINKTLSQITVDVPVTALINSIIVKHGVQTNAPVDGKELTGMQAIIDTTTFSNTLQGLSKITFPSLQATLIAPGAVDITNPILQSCESQVENASNAMVDHVWSGRGQRDKYLEILTPLKRFMDDDQMDSGKRKAVEWNGKPWDVDFLFPVGQIAMLSPGSFQKFVLNTPDIEDRDGDVIRQLPNSDVWTGYYKSRMNTGTVKPNAHGRIVGLNEPA